MVLGLALRRLLHLLLLLLELAVEDYILVVQGNAEVLALRE